MSSLLSASKTRIFKPSTCAAGCISRKVVSVAAGEAGLTRTAMRVAPGTSSRKISSRFATSSADTKLMPVTLPPGRAMLATRPRLTGSLLTTKTIGIVPVEAFAASTTSPPSMATMTRTLWRSNSAASAGSRSRWPSAQRYSIAKVSPSTWPASFSPWRSARSVSTFGSGVVNPRNPTTGSADCCARAASGHAAAPLSSVMNSRRLIFALTR